MVAAHALCRQRLLWNLLVRGGDGNTSGVLSSETLTPTAPPIPMAFHSDLCGHRALRAIVANTDPSTCAVFKHSS